uniref:Thiosulfate sulfurtransferase 16, chloroplastic n=1 Tax=Noccaea caerulescens TaxID=107243 RepID=A0A1J3J9K1_NOCCA
MKKSSKMGIIQSIVKSSNMAAEGRVPIPSSVPVRGAHEHLLAGHRYLDVRTPEEFRQGHACGAINVPYMNRGMSKNPNFLEQVSSHFKQSDEILVGCQSGGRSFKATADLLDAGFTGVTDVAGGYTAWTQNGLPTQHS